MIAKKKLKEIAKGAFKRSLTDGAVDAKKVRGILADLKAQHKAGLKNILKNYKKLVSLALLKEELTLETGDKFTPSKKFEDELLAKTDAKRITYKTNSKLVFGARITHGDWIYDASLAGKIAKLLD